jgi:hypothetical protein
MRIARAGSAAVVIAAGLALLSAPAADAAAYRYWTYWHGKNGAWAFATAGPASVVPTDGSVEGWRFAVTTQAGSPSDSPGVVPSFDAICGASPAPSGQKRVALVIDPGSAASAPEGQLPPEPSATCVVVDQDATGYQVLRSAVVVRTEGGLVCGIADYPADECAPVVDEPAPGATKPPSPSAVDSASPAAVPSATSPRDDSDPGSPLWTAGVLAALAAVGGVLVWRRSRG